MAQRGEDIPPGEFRDSGRFSFGTSKNGRLEDVFPFASGYFQVQAPRGV